MDKSNLELFKQAISEGLSEKFDSVVDSCTEEIVCSDQHKLAMRTIIYGKGDTKKSLSPKMKRIIAIIVAAALLLTSCAVIFRNEIREVIEEFFVKLTYSGDGTGSDTIEEVYELTYLPEGYILDTKNISYTATKFEYINSTGNYIYFEQHTIDGSEFAVDSESGYSQIKEIEEYDVYYRKNSEQHFYVWNENKYSFCLISDFKISDDVLVEIINGIKK